MRKKRRIKKISIDKKVLYDFNKLLRKNIRYLISQKEIYIHKDLLRRLGAVLEYQRDYPEKKHTDHFKALDDFRKWCELEMKSDVFYEYRLYDR